MVTLEFTSAEIRTMARLSGNLMAVAFESELDPGVLESIYYKTSVHLADDDDDNF